MRIENDPFTLAGEVAKWGESPEVVLEATYGWYWAHLGVRRRHLTGQVAPALRGHPAGLPAVGVLLRADAR